MLKIVFSIIGTLIGAGFASGQEIYTFFFKYGTNGIVGILVAVILLVLVINKSLIIIKDKKIETYKKFLDEIFKGETKNKYLNFKYITNLVINIFMLITYFIMVAGFGAYLKQEFGINNIIGSAILATLSYFVATSGKDKILDINKILIPILIFFLIFIGIIIIQKVELTRAMIGLGEGITATNMGIIYASYNAILLIPFLITLKGSINNKKEIKVISVLSGIIMAVLSYTIFMMLGKINMDISTLEMPAVYIVGESGEIFRYIYGLIILSSIFTTSIAIQKSFLQNTCKDKKSYTHIVAIMCIISVATAQFGFSNLVKVLFNLFGYLGIMQIFKILTYKSK